MRTALLVLLVDITIRKSKTLLIQESVCMTHNEISYYYQV